MGFLKPEETAQAALQAGYKKANMGLGEQIPLGFAAGAFVALGYLLALRASAGLPEGWEGMAPLISAAVFPIGLILCMIAGGELLTGNMMSLSMAVFNRKASVGQLAKNWIIITLCNFAGAIFVAYMFGHVLGMTETGAMFDKMVSTVDGKLEESFLHAFISAIGCNWLVCLGVWMAYGAKDGAGKIFGIWFPTMTFVALGFQHIVANMFVIPAGIFAGQATWGDYFVNFVPVFLGNAVGGSLFVAGIYYSAFMRRSRKKADIADSQSEHAALGDGRSVGAKPGGTGARVHS